MAPSITHLPNGQTLTVTPIFGGISFKSNDLHSPSSVFPPGWTVILHSEDHNEDDFAPSTAAHTQPAPSPDGVPPQSKTRHVHRFRSPSLRNDHLFISSISIPNSNDYKPANSPTRQIAMMLWATLWWYFHQPEPELYLRTAASANTPDEGKPKGPWRVHINREGVFKSKHLLPKLERMGLIASEDSSVGLNPEDGVSNTGEGWSKMFVSRTSFWQLDPRIYLFTLSPTQASSPFPSVSPANSRPASPSRAVQAMSMTRATEDSNYPSSGLSTPPLGTHPPPLVSRHTPPTGPFASSSHLPTFYPPPPLQYTFTNNIRHPIRPKPVRQGETFYTRYIPSLGEYLSFRVASLSKSPCCYKGPTSTTPMPQDNRRTRDPGLDSALAALKLKQDHAASPDEDPTQMSDIALLHRWMNDPRVDYSWGCSGSESVQTEFLSSALQSRHSFPAIGCFDGKPFGFFEIYWAKEDQLSKYLGHDVGDWDRGLHCLVGEQEFRGHHRVRVWLSALVHYCWLADTRTEKVFMEPRVDGKR